jgi:hypothetical protein
VTEDKKSVTDESNSTQNGKKNQTKNLQGFVSRKGRKERQKQKRHWFSSRLTSFSLRALRLCAKLHCLVPASLHPAYVLDFSGSVT